MACPVLIGNFVVSGVGVERIALHPDGSLVYGASDVLGTIRRYDYPGLSYQADEVGSPGAGLAFDRTGLAVDGAGILYWTDYVTATDTTRIRKDAASPTTLCSETGKFNGWTLCWSPFDDMLYGLDDYTGELFSVDTATGTKTVVASSANPRGSGSSLVQPVPTLDGGIWWQHATQPNVKRYDITATTVASITGESPAWRGLFPRPNNDAWEETKAYTYSAGSLSSAAHGCSMQAALQSVAYTPDLNLVCYLRSVATGEVYEAREGGVWTAGRVAWGSRGAWH